MKFLLLLSVFLFSVKISAQNVSDCPQAVVLCDTSDAVFQQSNLYAGNIITELDDALCFNNGTFGVNNESNSTWLSWKCAQSGSLIFIIRPLEIDNDIDFALYRLPNGFGNCEGKELLRCNAAGASYPSPCMGPTGLEFNDTDISENTGCGDVGDDAFLMPFDMVEGEIYTLCVNNYTPSSAGFSISFGGTGTFVCDPLQNDQLSGYKEINLFPNPTNEYFSLQKVENIDLIRIYHLDGREAKSFLVNDSNRYSIGNLPSGSYFVSLFDKNGLLNKVIRIGKF
jgi:hypothetical protein